MAESLSIRPKIVRQPSESWVGFRHGMLTVVAFEGIAQFNKGKACVFRFRCDCGNEFTAQKSNVIRKRQDCGCQRPEPTRTQPPGAWSHPLCKTWQHIFERCDNPKNKSFKDYGARGIKICDRWRYGDGALTGFECFLADMGPRPDGFTIERDDFNGDYEPGNCRWISKPDQGKNARGVRLLTINGVTKTIPDWCEETGVKYFTAHRRIKRGMDPELAVTLRVA